MGVNVNIKDGSNGFTAKVSKYGQLMTGPIDYSTASVLEMGTVNTGYSFIPPMQDRRIVITSVLLTADKDVSGTVNADIEIYESSTGVGTDVANSLLQIGMLKLNTQVIPLNLITSEGVWVMGKTSDDDIVVSIYYYYVPVVD